MAFNRKKKKHHTTFYILGLTVLCVVLTVINVLVHSIDKKMDNVVLESAEPTASHFTSDIVVTTPSPSISQEPEPQYGFSTDEVYLLAQLLCGDSSTDGDGEYDFDFCDPDNLDYYEIGKVLCVVMNRVRDDRFPDTVTDVVLADGQFTVMPGNLDATPSDIALEITKEWCDAYDNYDWGIQCVPKSHVYFCGDGSTNKTYS